jgi:hypothetical protein
MACQIVKADGITAIVCAPRPRPRRCGCRAPATLLCDWKVGKRTCDKPICTACAEEVAPDKHLCPEHQAGYREWLDRRRAKLTAES